MATKKEKLRDVLLNAPAPPSVEGFLQEFFALAGGPKVLARLLWDEFNASEPGSPTRNRVMELLLRSLKFADEKRNDPTDMGLLSDEDLEREIARQEAEIMATTGDDTLAADPAP